MKEKTLPRAAVAVVAAKGLRCAAAAVAVLIAAAVAVAEATVTMMRQQKVVAN